MTDYERGVEQASAIYKEVIREYVAENTKLRNEVANMYREMQGVLDMSSDTVWVDKFGTLRDHMDAHMESMRDLGIQPPDYDQRMRELGLAEEEE